MPVKSLITSPKTGAIIDLGKTLQIHGHAWAGDLEVEKMEYSIDYGSTWKSCTISQPVNRHAWQHFQRQCSTHVTSWLESQRISQ